MAIAQATKAINPGLACEYQTLDDFVEAYHAALAAGQGDVYRRRYAEVQLLLLDDVQFLARRREMQAELLRLVNTMQTAGHQIVLTSDRGPEDIEALDERLVQRFAGGLVIDITPPDYETRRRHCPPPCGRARRELRRRRAGGGGPPQYTNVRELIGALNRLIAFQAVRTSRWRRRQVPGWCWAVPRPGKSAAAGTAVEEQADEFSAFLSEITSTVVQQVEAWRGRVAEAVLRWEGEGYPHRAAGRASRSRKMPPDPDGLLAALCEADVERLRALEAEATDLDTALGGHAVFRDPDRLEEAEAAGQQRARGRGAAAGPSPYWRLGEFAEGPGNRIAVTRGPGGGGATRIALQPAGHRGPERHREDPPAARHRQRARAGEDGRGRRLSGRAGIRGRADRRHRPGPDRLVADALPAGDRASCWTTSTCWPARTAPRRSCSGCSMSWRKRAGRWSSLPRRR